MEPRGGSHEQLSDFVATVEDKNITVYTEAITFKETIITDENGSFDL